VRSDLGCRAVWASLTIALIVICGCKRPEPVSTKQAEAKATPFVITDKTKWKTVEEFSYKWSAVQPAANFKLELPEGYDDPGNFIRIRIKVGSHPEFVLDNANGWVEYNNQEQKSEFYAKAQKQNLTRSKYVLILPSTVDKTGPPLIFLRSWGYASNAERLHIISFKPSGEPITLLNTELDLLEVNDLDGDGNMEVAGRPCLSQGFGPDLLTYDPLRVYKIPHPITSSATISLELMKSYNLKHYYGWAGPDCSEDLAVVLHPPGGGKPVILPQAEARKPMEKGKM
jgi:hypothetical protein